MFNHLVESKRERPSLGRALLPKMISLLIQGSVLALLIIIPLMATETLPSPEGIMTFMAPAPPPPPPPPPAAAPPTAAKRPRPPSVLTQTSTPQFVAPAEIPDQIGGPVSEQVDFGVPGIEGGVPGGVEGGLPGEPLPEPVRVGGDVKAPAKIKDVKPFYPEGARHARVEGTVVLEAIIDPLGRVTNLRIIQSIPLLDQAALNAVRQWQFRPTRLNGEAVPVIMTVTVNFSLA